MRNRRHQILALVLIICSVPFLSTGCKTKEQPAETNTMGNATDRNPATGTNGTGEPVSPATGTATAAQQLGTVAPSSATGTAPVVTGTEDVNAQKSDTTSTLQGPGGTTTASVATPTDTTATIKTTTGTTTATVKKH
jgi:hypothetical protein